MNRSILIALSAVAATVGAIFLIKKGRDTGATPADAPAPPPPPSQPDAPGKAYYPDDFEVKQAIASRINQYMNDRKKAQQIGQVAGIYTNLFNGVKYPSGLQKVIAAQLGSPFNLPIIPSETDPVYNQKWAYIEQLNGFESLTAGGGGFENALKSWKNALRFSEYGFELWPDPADIEAGVFGPTKKGDRNRSERYDAFTKDTKALAANVTQASKRLYEAMETQALNDLSSAGWNIAGL